MPTTKVGSQILYYDDFGAGHPLILIIGLGANRLGWWKQIEPFSRRFRVINLDNRDGGDSGLATAPYTIADMADDVAELISNLNLGRSHVVAVSMGGEIAQELAIRHPMLVDKLVVAATTAGGPTYVSGKPETMALLTQTDGDGEARARRLYTAVAAEGYMAAHPEDLDQIVKFSLSKPMSLESYQRQLCAVLGHHQKGTADRLSQIIAPTLVIHGEDDPLMPYSNGQFLAEHIKGARLSTFGGTGHLVMIESPERFNSEVIDFLG